MGKKNESTATSAEDAGKKKTAQNQVVDNACPYCSGERGHSISQRKACKNRRRS